MAKPALTHDEKKAAEAAFQKQPANPAWTEAARKVYDGISAAMLQAELAALGEKLGVNDREQEADTELVSS